MKSERPRLPVRTGTTSSLCLKTKRCFVLFVGLVAFAAGVFLFIRPFNVDSPVWLAGKPHHWPIFNSMLLWSLRLFFCGGGLFMIMTAFRSPRHVDKACSDFINGT